MTDAEMRKPYAPGQEELISWLLENGVKATEGVPYPERIVIIGNGIELNLFGAKPSTGELVSVDAWVDLTVEPPASLGIPRREA